MSAMTGIDTKKATPSGQVRKADAIRYRRFRYAIDAMCVIQFGVLMVGIFMADVRAALWCHAAAVVLLVLIVLAHLAAQQGGAHG